MVTHLDALKNNKALNKTKKRLKQRFWTEIYDVRCSSSWCCRGCRVFVLGGPACRGMELAWGWLWVV